MGIADMKRPSVLLIGFLLLGSTLAAGAQEPQVREEMRFVNELRARRYNDLALQYLERLAKTASPELARELPLEIAKTRLEIATEEPDSNKRLALYQQARTDFEKFIKASKDHPRVSEAKLDLANVAVLQGKTQLSKALLQDSLDAKIAEGLKARELLVGAGEQLKQAAAEVEAQLAKAPDTTPAEKAAKKKLETDHQRAELSTALNLFDQAQTYFGDTDTAVLKERGGKIEEARKVLERIASGDANSPIVWQARAWVARCYIETGEPGKARTRLAEIIGAPPSFAVAEGQRLARYFRLLAISEDPQDKATAAEVILEAAPRWIADYPGYAKTTEGYGIRYLLARTLITQAENPKETKKDTYLTQARALLRQIEQTENDYTDRARQLKIVTMAKQGAFTRPIGSLLTFEDCYVRAQYEIIQMAKVGENKNIADEKEREARRKEHLKLVMAALERGLARPDVKGKSSLELNNARAMLAFYRLNNGKYKEAIEVGEEFARRDPRSSQASMAAVYALQAYAKITAEAEANRLDVQDERAKMLELAKYMEERWPRELAGDMARHQMGLMLLREKKFPEAIKKLGGIAPTYPSYAYSQLQLAEAALEAEKEKEEPVAGEKPYRQRALEALESIPDSTLGIDPTTNRVFYLARIRLGRELFKVKKYKEMSDIAAALLQKLSSVHFTDEAAADKALHEQFLNELTDLTLYARYGLANVELTRPDFAKVAELVDPLVKDLNDGKLPQMKKNMDLAMALLGMDLKANVQLGKVDQTRAVLKALQDLSAEGGAEAGTTAILKQLIGLIRQQVDELRKKGDKENLTRAVTGFSTILDDLREQQQKKQLTPEFILLLAQCYSSMDQHDKATRLLEQVQEPKGNDSEALKRYHGAQLLLVRELRKGDKIEKAQKLLDEIIGTRQKPGWGLRSIDCLKERVLLLEDAKQYKDAALLANSMVTQLTHKVNDSTALKEQYLECYYHVTYSMLKHAQGLSGAAKQEGIRKAAVQMLQLEQRWNGFGSDASTKRFNELLEKEKDLSGAYTKLRKSSQ
jgi:hypothetical protein